MSLPDKQADILAEDVLQPPPAPHPVLPGSTDGAPGKGSGDRKPVQAEAGAQSGNDTEGDEGHKALARKWRPKGFAAIVGQDHVVHALSNLIKSGRWHHAYLLTGTRGVGKTTLARILAKAFNCEVRKMQKVAEPCNKCGPCMETDKGANPDVLEIDAASNTKVEDMRDILENTMYLPSSGEYRVFIIDEVHMLSKHAFNAMLKTLEEPPPHVKFILATTDPQKLPVTILSRCLQFNLRTIRPKTIRARLEDVLKEESVEHEDGTLQLVAEQADGSLRDALSLLDQVIAHGDGRAEKQAVLDIIGLTGTGDVEELLAAIVRNDCAAIHEKLDSLYELGKNLDDLLARIATRLHRAALASVLPEDPDATEEKPLGIGHKEAHVLYEIAVNARRTMPFGPDDRTATEMALLRMAWFATENPLPADVPRPKAKAARPPDPTPARRDAAPPPRSVPAEDAPPEDVPGDAAQWAAIVGKMATGFTRSTAKACSFDRAEGNRVFLRSSGVNASKADLIAKELTRLCKRTVKVEIAEGDHAAPTPKQQQDEKEKMRHAADVAEAKADPGIRQVVETFPGSRIIEQSVTRHDSPQEGT